jgi:hypothetical protein
MSGEAACQFCHRHCRACRRVGRFVLPILFRVILDWLGINSSCFMFLYGVVLVSLILSYTTEVRRLPVMGEGFPTDHTNRGILASFLERPHVFDWLSFPNHAELGGCPSR